MARQMCKVNSLKAYVEEAHLERRSATWSKVTEAQLEEFPRLTDEQLRELTLGVYQLKLSPFYIQEHLSGECDIFVHHEHQNLLRVKIQSRHTTSKQYLLWIEFNNTDIVAWYCKCRAGARVVGVCAHIAAVVWYLGYARYRYVDPAAEGVQDWSQHLHDAGRLNEPVDESESETDSDSSD